MSKLKIIYILLLVVLGILVVFTLFKPMTPGSKYSEVQRQSLLKTEIGWVVQFDVFNHEGSEQNYTIQFAIGESAPYIEEILLKDKMSFTFVRRISKQEVEGKTAVANFSVYKKGEDTPLNRISYNLE